KVPLYVSLEERMGCGVGACLVCSVKIKTADGWKYERVCRDGPVFNAEEVCWDE
ncbi:MAG: dihydroorotate dehydrogenase electron transfer subunit, partial [Oscillospiraceae bacterium]|nr:dihydroorotate dehydrogenase electron transfer subunit [Oscillospiraceae bacterium]